MINPQLERLFTEYEKAFQVLDFKKTAQFFSDTFTTAGPRGTIAHGKDDFLKQAEKAAQFYKSAEQTSIRILHEKEIPISENYALVTIHWGATFKKTGDTLIEFDVTYIVHLRGNYPEIILSISHQDEQEAMNKLGLLQQKETELNK
jgi:ketosteroid isomerase-like protein